MRGRKRERQRAITSEGYNESESEGVSQRERASERQQAGGETINDIYTTSERDNETVERDNGGGVRERQLQVCETSQRAR